MMALTCILFLCVFTFLFPGTCGSNFLLSDCDSGQFDVLLMYRASLDTYINVTDPVRKAFARVQENDDRSRVLVHTVKYYRTYEKDKKCTILFTKDNSTDKDYNSSDKDYNSSDTECINGTNDDFFFYPSQYMENIRSMIKTVSIIFNETGIARANSTRFVNIFLIVPFNIHLNTEVMLTIQDILQEESSEIKFFVTAFDYFNRSQITYLKHIALIGWDMFNAGHVLPMALCGQCRPGRIKHMSTTGDMSCYNPHTSTSKETWKKASRRCENEGGNLAAIESQEELEFVRELLYNCLHNSKVGRKMKDYKIYIGLRRMSNIGVKSFQWSMKYSRIQKKHLQLLMKYPISYRPVHLNYWLNKSIPEHVDRDCGAWQYNYTGKHSQPNISTKTGFSSSEKNILDNWIDIDCDQHLTKYSLCEVALPRLLQGSSLVNITPANPTSFSKTLRRNEFRSFQGEIVSVSAFVRNQSFLNFLKERNESFEVFDCEDGTEISQHISYSHVCDCQAHCSNWRDESVCGSLETWPCFFNKYSPVIDSLEGLDDNEVKGCKKECTGLYSCPFCKRIYFPRSFFRHSESDFSKCTSNKDLSDNDGFCPDVCSFKECMYPSQLNYKNCTIFKQPWNESIKNPIKVTEYFDKMENLIWFPHCVYVVDSQRSIIGCEDSSHLQNCASFQCQEGYWKCPSSYCIPQHYIRDKKMDCPMGEDENVLADYTCEGNFACWEDGSQKYTDWFGRTSKRKICLHPDRVCDGHADCPHKDDELNCNVSCADGFRCIAGTVTVDGYNTSVTLKDLSFIDSEIRYLDLSGIYLSSQVLNSIGQFKNLRYVRLSRCNITDNDGSFGYAIYDKSLIEIDLSYNKISSSTGCMGCFLWHKDLRKLNLSFNIDVLEICHYFSRSIEILDLFHTGLSYLEDNCFKYLIKLKHLNLSHTRLFTFNWDIFSPKHELDTLDLRGSPIVNISTNTLNIKIKTALYTDNFRLCCPQFRGTEIPEHVCRTPGDDVSSCSDLIADQRQRVLLWLLAAIALVGNLVVVVYRLNWDRAVLRKAYGLFVTNLGISDLIMGLYLLVIAGADVYYRDVYVHHDTEWKESTLCKVAGFLATLSSETSTFFIFLITVDRFLALKFPYGQIKFTRLSKVIALVLSWAVGFTLALVVALPIYRSDSIFTSSAMCIALPLTNKRLPGWEYSLSVFIILNFFMFLSIALGQIAIFRAVLENRISNEFTNQKYLQRAQEIDVAKHLFLVVLSDFLCWFPVGLIGLLSLGGHVISNDVYSWIVVLVIPINSAVNPLLYTIPVVKEKWKEFKYGNSSPVYAFASSPHSSRLTIAPLK